MSCPNAQTLKRNPTTKQIPPIPTSPNPLPHRNRRARPRGIRQLNQRLKDITTRRSSTSLSLRDRHPPNRISNIIQRIDRINRRPAIKEINHNKRRLSPPLRLTRFRRIAQIPCPAGRRIRRPHVAGIRVFDVKRCQVRRVQEVVH